MSFKNNFPRLIFSSALLIATVDQVMAETVLRYAEATPNRGVRADALMYFSDQLREQSGGDLKLDIHWGGALLKYSATLSGVSAGSADMGSVLAAYEPQKMRALSVGDIPVPQSDTWVGMRAMYELMTKNDELQKSFEKSGVVYVTNFSTSAMQFECAGDVRIEKLEDFSGKKVRASAIYAKILDDAGANMVNFTYSEVYQALDTGLVDCSGSYLYAMQAFKTPEVISSLSLMEWGQIAGFAMVMNKWAWDDLTSGQQGLMRKVGSEMIDFYAEKIISENKSVLDKLPTGELGKKVEVIEWGDQERADLFFQSDKYIEAWVKDMRRAGMDGEKIWDEYQMLLERYQVELDEKGYPWTRG